MPQGHITNGILKAGFWIHQISKICFLVLLTSVDTILSIITESYY